MTRHLIEENVWRAQRYGLEAEFIVDDGARTVAVPQLLSEALELVCPDARMLDAHGMLGTLRTILVRGTSAHEQIHIYETGLASGLSHREALSRVVDWLLRTTHRRKDDDGHELHGTAVTAAAEGVGGGKV